MAKFREVLLDDAAVLVTLDDPKAKLRPDELKDTFVRLRPPPNTPPEVVEQWRANVAKHARAVKVMPTSRNETIAQTSKRVDVALTKIDVRAALKKLVDESTCEDKKALHEFCENVASEVKL